MGIFAVQSYNFIKFKTEIQIRFISRAEIIQVTFLIVKQQSYLQLVLLIYVYYTATYVPIMNLAIHMSYGKGRNCITHGEKLSNEVKLKWI